MVRNLAVINNFLKISTVPHLISGYQIYHNYVRPRMSLDGQTPADKAGIKIEGKNKWITLIQNELTMAESRFYLY